MDHNVNYQTLRDRVHAAGQNYAPRGLGTKEVLVHTSRFYMGEVVGRPKMNVKLGFMEGLQMLAGTAIVDAVEAVAPKVDRSLFTIMSFYGPRIFDQVSTVLAELKRDPLSRRAVFTVAGDPVAQIPANLEPCTVAIQLLIRGSLHLVAYMRSSDVVWGVPYDVMQFGLFGIAMADCLAVHPGFVYLVGGSVHEYNATSDVLASGDARFFDVHCERNHENALVDWRSWAIKQVASVNSWKERGAPDGVHWLEQPAILASMRLGEDGWE